MNSKIGPTPRNAPDVGTHLKENSLDNVSQGKQKGEKRQKLGARLSSPQRRGGGRGNAEKEKKRSLYPSLLACGVLRVSALSASCNLAYETRRILRAIVSLSLLLSCLSAPP